jgi:hypothetical protein
MNGLFARSFAPTVCGRIGWGRSAEAKGIFEQFDGCCGAGCAFCGDNGSNHARATRRLLWPLV